MNKKRKPRFAALAFITALVSTLFAVSPVAVSGQTVPPAQDPILVFEEDFESASALPGDISTFTGTAGGYTADSYWLRNANCNGILISNNSDGAAFNGCNGGSANTPMDLLGNIASALGDGDDDNVALAGYTAGYVAGSDVQLATNAFTVTDYRFYYASVDVGIVNCHAAPAIHEFFIGDGSTSTPGSTTTSLGVGSDPCVGFVDGGRGSASRTTPRVQTIESPTAHKWDQGTSMVLSINNLTLTAGGNDAAIDNLRLYDVTPTLFKDFSPTPIVNGQTTTLVLTFVNTSDLLAKPGMAFEDNLTTGLTVTPGATLGGTCTGVTGTASGSLIDIDSVDLQLGEASCTIEIEITPGGLGCYDNGVNEVSDLEFLKPPANTATLCVEPAPPVVEDQVSNGNPVGSPVTIDPLAGATDLEGDIDPTSVMILDENGDPVTELVVPGEGTWTVDPDTGAITFTPEPGFTGDPAPIDFTVSDLAGNVSEPAPITVEYGATVMDDKSLGNELGTAVTVDVVGNDANVDPTTVMIEGPSGPVTELVVPGEGTWTVDPDTGAITFTPEPGFEGNPTAIEYTAEDEDGNVVPPAEVVVGYTPIAEPDESLDNAPGSTVTVDVLGNDPTLDLDPTTVAIDDPNYDPSSGTLVVPGEGTWTVDPVTGAISFEPEAGFEGDPTPITYTVEDADGNEVSADVVVTYLAEVPDDASLGNAPGTAVTVDVVGNDGDVDPTTVMVVDPATGEPVTELVVAGEGTWTVDPVTGALTFTPDSGFDGDPTPVDYVVTSVLGETLTATATVTYTASTPALALTGVESRQLALMAALLLAAGYGMTQIAARREDEA